MVDGLRSERVGRAFRIVVEHPRLTTALIVMPYLVLGGSATHPAGIACFVLLVGLVWAPFVYRLASAFRSGLAGPPPVDSPPST